MVYNQKLSLFCFQARLEDTWDCSLGPAHSPWWKFWISSSTTSSWNSLIADTRWKVCLTITAKRNWQSMMRPEGRILKLCAITVDRAWPQWKTVSRIHTKSKFVTKRMINSAASGIEQCWKSTKLHSPSMSSMWSQFAFWKMPCFASIGNMDGNC